MSVNHPDIYPFAKKLQLTCHSCPDCILAANHLKPRGYEGVQDLNQSPRTSTMMLQPISKWKEQIPSAAYETPSSLPKMLPVGEENEKTVMKVVENPETGEIKYFIGEQEVRKEQFLGSL